MTKFEMAQVLFSDFGIEITEVTPKKEKLILSTNHTVQEALEKELQRAKKDLSKIIGGFCWATSRDNNADGFTIYLDEIRYER